MPNGDKYVGNFKHGHYDGEGIIFYVNGNRYEGNFQKSNRVGVGVFIFANGDKYERDATNFIIVDGVLTNI